MHLAARREDAIALLGAASAALAPSERQPETPTAPLILAGEMIVRVSKLIDLLRVSR